MPHRTDHVTSGKIKAFLNAALPERVKRWHVAALALVSFLIGALVA